MGFFSSRKAEDSVSYVTTTTHVASNRPAGDRSMAQVIRSRFYGKKGKDREERLPISSSSTKTGLGGRYGRSTTSVLLPIPTTPYDSIGASPRPSTSQRPIPTSLLQKPNDDLPPLPATPHKKRADEVVPGSASSVRTRNDLTTPTRKGDTSAMISPTPHRKNADSVTVTLAQRLNELAIANSEGLLNDDEYRLLRQSLFDRFAGIAVVPQEEPIVPAVRPRPKKTNGTPDRSTSRRLSNFRVELPRPTSMHSRSSMSFGVSDLIRKATRQSSSVPKDSDTSSVWSTRSSSSKLFRLPQALSKKSSNSSINTTTSKMQVDTMSISSKRGGGAVGNSDSVRGHSDQSHQYHSSPSGPRPTTGSIRKYQTPPSSFPTRVIGQDARYSTAVRDVFDEGSLKTAHDIEKEILAVEGEQRRLLDAFNGLELTTLSKARRHHNAKPSTKGSESNAESPWSDIRSHKRLNPSENDALSIRSGNSALTTPSVAPSISRSAYSNRNKTLRAKNLHMLNPSLGLGSSSSLHRKDSSSSFASDGRRLERGQGAPPPVPALPLNISQHLRTNYSSISLARSTGHLPMDVVHEDEDRVTLDTVRMEEDEFEHEQEMEDIRRRREEVNMRYEARLEYLRAKLKGAQLHEKLLQK